MVDEVIRWTRRWSLVVGCWLVSVGWSLVVRWWLACFHVSGFSARAEEVGSKRVSK